MLIQKIQMLKVCRLRLLNIVLRVVHYNAPHLINVGEAIYEKNQNVTTFIIPVHECKSYCCRRDF